MKIDYNLNNMATEQQAASLHLKFSGADLPEGSIDVYDLANSILAIGQSVESIARDQNLQPEEKIKIDVSALRPGSFEVDLLVKIVTTAVPAVMATPLIVIDGLSKAKAVIDILDSVIKVKKFLGGEKPKSVTIDQSGPNPTATIYNFSGDNTTVNIAVYGALQNKTLNENVKKIFKPLAKEDGNVDAIELSTGLPEVKEEDIVVKKEEYQYFEATDELQTTPNFKIKGIVSAFDRKTNTGRVTLNDHRAVFEVEIVADLNEYDAMIMAIIESLKLKVPVYLIGDAVIDLSSKLKKIKVKKVEAEAKLI